MNIGFFLSSLVDFSQGQVNKQGKSLMSRPALQSNHNISTPRKNHIYCNRLQNRKICLKVENCENKSDMKF